jgi:thioredoxin-related protein
MKEKISLLLGLMTLFTINAASKNKGFVLHGNVKNVADSTMIYLHNMSTDVVIDSTYILKNQFTFTGHTNKVDEFWLYINTVDNINLLAIIYIGNETFSITCDAAISNNYNNAEVTGSQINDGSNALDTLKKPYQHKIDSIKACLKNSNLTEDEEGLKWDEISALYKQTVRVENDFIKDNTSCFYSIIQLYWNKSYFDKDTLYNLYIRFPKKTRNSQYGKAIKFYSQNSATTKGTDFYDFEAIDLDGNKHLLSEINKDYILLTFCRPRCPGCNYALEQLGDIENTYHDSLAVVSFFETGNKKSWKDECQKFKVDWLTLSDLKGGFSEVIMKYDVYSFPTFILIDKKRKVVDISAGCASGDYLKNYFNNFFQIDKHWIQ